MFTKQTVIVYSKICLQRPLKKKTKNWLSRPIIAQCRSKVLQNAPRDHSAILSYRLMQVKSIAECSKRAFCNTFDRH